MFPIIDLVLIKNPPGIGGHIICQKFVLLFLQIQVYFWWEEQAGTNQLFPNSQQISKRISLNEKIDQKKFLITEELANLAYGLSLQNVFTLRKNKQK